MLIPHVITPTHSTSKSADGTPKTRTESTALQSKFARLTNTNKLCQFSLCFWCVTPPFVSSGRNHFRDQPDRAGGKFTKSHPPITGTSRISLLKEKTAHAVNPTQAVGFCNPENYVVWWFDSVFWLFRSCLATALERTPVSGKKFREAFFRVSCARTNPRNMWGMSRLWWRGWTIFRFRRTKTNAIFNDMPLLFRLISLDPRGTTQKEW